MDEAKTILWQSYDRKIVGCLEVQFAGYLNKMLKMFLLQHLHYHIFCGGDMLPKKPAT